MEGVERYRVRLLPHHEEWAEEYRQVEREIAAAWNGDVVDIQHVGSTAIRGILAKPVLDVAVRLRSVRSLDVEALTSLGYDYCGARRERDTCHLFVLRGDGQISLRHVHCYDAGDDEYFKLIGFRDHMNSHPDAARRYSELKEALASSYPDDRAAYTRGKEDFIRGIADMLQT